jgi:hypothetical protein
MDQKERQIRILQYEGIGERVQFNTIPGRQSCSDQIMELGIDQSR